MIFFLQFISIYNIQIFNSRNSVEASATFTQSDNTFIRKTEVSCDKEFVYNYFKKKKHSFLSDSREQQNNLKSISRNYKVYTQKSIVNIREKSKTTFIKPFIGTTASQKMIRMFDKSVQLTEMLLKKTLSLSAKDPKNFIIKDMFDFDKKVCIRSFNIDLITIISIFQ